MPDLSTVVNSIKHVESICYNSGNWSKAKKTSFACYKLTGYVFIV